MNISSIFYFSKSTSINTRYSSLWGHSEDDAVHKIPHKLKTHWQNQLKFSVLVWFKILYRARYKKKDFILVQCPFKYYQQHTNCPRSKWIDPSRVKAPYAHARVMCSECNCTKIMHACYFRVFWVSSIQIGCSMRVLSHGVVLELFFDFFDFLFFVRSEVWNPCPYLRSFVTQKTAD